LCLAPKHADIQNRHNTETFSLAVMALTKSGKSTLLNALLGADILPADSVPATARICRVRLTTAGVRDC
jgi:50S ribosomal subunit-associated GTPase HflX